MIYLVLKWIFALVVYLIFAIVGIVGIFRAKDIAKFNAKENRSLGLEFLARQNEENTWATKVVATIFLLMAIYGLFQGLTHFP